MLTLIFFPPWFTTASPRAALILAPFLAGDGLVFYSAPKVGGDTTSTVPESTAISAFWECACRLPSPPNRHEILDGTKHVPFSRRCVVSSNLMRPPSFTHFCAVAT